MTQSLRAAHVLSLTFFISSPRGCKISHFTAARALCVHKGCDPALLSRAVININCLPYFSNKSLIRFSLLCCRLPATGSFPLREFCIIPCLSPSTWHWALPGHTHTHTPSNPLLSVWLLTCSAAEFTAGLSQACSTHMLFVFLSQFLEFTHFRALELISARVSRQDWQCPCSKGKHGALQCKPAQLSSKGAYALQRATGFFGLLQAGPPTSS